MNTNQLTIKAQEALQSAVSLARERGQQAVEPLHLLQVIIADDNALGAFLLGRIGVAVPMLRNEVADAVARLPKVSGSDQFFSRETLLVIQRAIDFTKNFKDKYASVEHLLLGLVAERGAASEILKRNGVSEKQLIEASSSARVLLSIRRPLRRSSTLLASTPST